MSDAAPTAESQSATDASDHLHASGQHNPAADLQGTRVDEHGESPSGYLFVRYIHRGVSAFPRTTRRVLSRPSSGSRCAHLNTCRRRPWVRILVCSGRRTGPRRTKSPTAATRRAPSVGTTDTRCAHSAIDDQRCCGHRTPARPRAGRSRDCAVEEHVPGFRRSRAVSRPSPCALTRYPS